MNYIIVDDNKMARIALKQIASQIEGIELREEFESAAEAYNFLGKNSIDFILLDIEMPDFSGLELAQRLHGRKVFIIYTTGKSEYAVDAFETNVVDYLVKPISLPRLITAIDKLKSIVTHGHSNQAVDLDYFFIKDKGSLHRVEVSSVTHIEAMGDYVKVYTPTKFYTVHSTLKKVEERLDSSHFIKVHRSSIVALRHIDKIEEGVIYIGQHRVSLSDSYKSALYEKLSMM